jgi:cadmium resistance protein CadD (predicted permease)
MITSATFAVALFASTNIDDIFILVGFFADPAYRTRQVVVGHYLGIAILVALSAVASLVFLVVKPDYVGWLGLLPILIGANKLFNLRHGRTGNDGGKDVRPGTGAMLVATVTIADGGDDIGVYTPVFANSSTTQLMIFVSVFTAMVALWLGCAFLLVNHPALNASIRRVGPVVTPIVLIALGFFILRAAHPLGAIGL